MYTVALLTVVAALFEAASAHGTFVTSVTNNDVVTKSSDPVWYYHVQNGQPRPVTAGWDSLNQDLGFVSPDAFTSADINCHKSTLAGQTYVNVKAGDTINFFWNTWPDSHKGPIISYIAPCNGECTSLSPSSLKWSKISQAGLLTATPGNIGIWATDNLMKNNFTAPSVILKNLKAGNYVVRYEIIVLHAAGTDNGAQIYPQCLNLKVSGSGTVARTSGVAGTSLYKRTDPGIRVNLFNSLASYTIPGPELWTAAN
ncbi:lytic polysaccharide monooxygenase [Karstenula rhodostoma CBS 690.94]|uniref:Lytic polysaccharide monooxygenase n=1 Tax=Karstenula rhodostoma CBS 690.94 TaxID=1392251 RepID=A0A9P4PGX3_9PLEO|nr:lytic polysaccharide monooxygenase [Karstenula rhodostoma CBS 690.94]